LQSPTTLKPFAVDVMTQFFSPFFQFSNHPKKRQA